MLNKRQHPSPREDVVTIFASKFDYRRPYHSGYSSSCALVETDFLSRFFVDNNKPSFDSPVQKNRLPWGRMGSSAGYCSRRNAKNAPVAVKTEDWRVETSSCGLPRIDAANKHSHPLLYVVPIPGHRTSESNPAGRP